ncbi:MAG: cob(I)yrinic acid a,c-diamide adenosyltransferase [Candidatus Altiarchaeota archaeon]|nr:cob(I)yrinic acid a,c-diamide adenosyltransferase [Candidatus Altiarchaeota archaeon]
MRSLKEVIEELPKLEELEKPVVLLLTGDGKGKTTAGIGQIVRAAGRGYKCAVMHFLKGVKVGEDYALEKLGVDVFWSGPEHFIDVYNPKEEEKQMVRDFWEKMKLKIREYDVVLFDEINLAVFSRIILAEELKPYAEKVKPYLLILVGRKAPPELIELSSVASEVKLIKHHYPKVGAMRGLEA